MDHASLGTRILARCYWLVPAIVVAASAVVVGNWPGGLLMFASQALFAWGVARAIQHDDDDLNLGGLIAQVVLLAITAVVGALLLGIPTFIALNSPGWVTYSSLAACVLLAFVLGLRLWPTPALVFADPQIRAEPNPLTRSAAAIRKGFRMNRNHVERTMEGAPLFASLSALTLVPFALQPFGVGAPLSTAWWVVFGLAVVFLPLIYGMLLSEIAEQTSGRATPDKPPAVSIFGAAREGDVSALRRLVSRDDVNAVREGKTALHIAINAPADRRDEMVSALLEAGADPSITDRKGRCPVHLAAIIDDDAVLRRLITAGSLVDVEDSDGETPLTLAASHGSWRCMRILMDQQGNGNLSEVLHLAAANAKDDPEGVEYLSRKGADVTHTAKLGRTALHAAAMRGNSSIAKALIEAGAVVNAQDDFGNTALMEAARAGANGVLRCLKSYSPDPNLVDKPGRTALLVAVTSRRAEAETAKLLLDLGADPKARNRDGRTAGELAVEGERWAIAEVLGVQRSESGSAVFRDTDTTIIDLKLFETSEDRAWAEAQTQKRSRTELASATGVMPALQIDEQEPAQEVSLDAVVDIAQTPDETDGDAGSTVYQSLLDAAVSDDVQQLESIADTRNEIPEWWLVSAFLNAVAEGNEIAPRWLLENGLSPDAQSEGGVSLLESTAQQAPPNTGVLEALLNAGAEPGRTPHVILWLCGMADQQHGIRPGHSDEILEQQLKVIVEQICVDERVRRATDGRLRTALHWAARYRSPACVDALIRCGLNVSAIDEGGNTPLMFATYSGRPNIALMLIKAGADAKQANKKGVSPLSYAMDKQDLTMSKILMRGAQSDAEETRIHSRPNDSLLDAASEGNVGRVKRLLTARPDLEASDSDGCTSLIRAAGKGHAQVVSALISGGANVDAASSNGTTALGAAVMGDHAGVVQTLVDKGVSPDQRQRHGVTPLMLASARWNGPMTGLLLRCGADATARDDSEGTPICAAVQNALGKSGVESGVVTLRHLLKAGADVNAANDEGQTPLMLLLGVRSKQDVRVSEQGLAQLATVLIEAGARVDQQDLSGWSALHAAAAHGFANVARLLMDTGCSRRVRDMNGLSPVDLAMNNAHEELVDLFIGRG